MDDRHYDDGTGLFDNIARWDVDIDQLLERSRLSEEERLERELEQINQQLAGRGEVHEEIVDELEWKIEWYTDRLESLYKTGRGRKDGTRDQLKNRIEDFYAALRQERREHWQDRQELEQERREVLRELHEVTDASLSDLV